MFFAFPALFAASFSGFYLPLMMVLWTLMGRALGIELRHQLNDPLWRSFWDVIFSVSSLLLLFTLYVLKILDHDERGRFIARAHFTE